MAINLNAVEARINYISNQRKVNTELLQADSPIGWLQSLSHAARNEVVHLLFENKVLLQSIKIDNINELIQLNDLRLDPRYKAFFQGRVEWSGQISMQVFEQYLPPYCATKAILAGAHKPGAPPKSGAKAGGT